jgi:hypothetical protein
MLEAGHFYGEIDRELRRRAGSTKRHLEGVGNGLHVRSMDIPNGVMAEREALVTAREQRRNATCWTGGRGSGCIATR